MSALDTRQALITRFLATTVTGLTVDDIGVGGEFFDPTNKALWAMLSFMPASSQAIGKTTSDVNEDRGIFQVSLFVPANIVDSDITLLTAVDQVRAGFQYNGSTVYNGQTVTVLDANVSGGGSSGKNAGQTNSVGAWYKRDISINYLTFSNRG